ncbi:hypothetical protein [Priestia megaterium]|nr:hypothetical protein [Priestia megaterium]TCN16097.1 hypothetical protein EV581_101928 [Bacillus sp. BK006]
MLLVRMAMIGFFSLTALSLFSFQSVEIIHAIMDFFSSADKY